MEKQAIYKEMLENMVSCKLNDFGAWLGSSLRYALDSLL
jgi:hypothetical protein